MYILCAILLLMSPVLDVKASRGVDSLCDTVYFRVGRSDIDPSFDNNADVLDSLVLKVRRKLDGKVGLRCILIVSGVSPEGPVDLNRTLISDRAISLRSYLQKHLSLPESWFTISYSPVWESLSSLVENSGMPNREEVLHILRETPERVMREGVMVDSRKRQLMRLHGGRTWNYMKEHFFPKLRNSCVVRYEFTPLTLDVPLNRGLYYAIAPGDTVLNINPIHQTSALRDSPGTFRMALRSNLLYDALLVPNIGLEFYLGKNWTAGGNWMYAWWNNDGRHKYWRIYGGDLFVRRYFGGRSKKHPMSGHHLGVYGQIFTYDYERGGRGYMGGKPGGTLWEKMNYATGLEYGYSLSVARRLNIDFSIALGYWGGIYHEYQPEGGYYMWRQTSRRSWIGPTKAEVSLVWLLGCGNSNTKKGGKR